jgi:hypothetical protein
VGLGPLPLLPKDRCLRLFETGGFHAFALDWLSSRASNISGRKAHHLGEEDARAVLRAVGRVKPATMSISDRGISHSYNPYYRTIHTNTSRARRAHTWNTHPNLHTHPMPELAYHPCLTHLRSSSQLKSQHSQDDSRACGAAVFTAVTLSLALDDFTFQFHVHSGEWRWRGAHRAPSPLHPAQDTGPAGTHHDSISPHTFHIRASTQC